VLKFSETNESNVSYHLESSPDMPFDTQAIVIPAPGQDFQLLDVTLDDPLDDEVIVDMVACGSVHRLPASPTQSDDASRSSLSTLG
jgi:hypothetical protein